MKKIGQIVDKLIIEIDQQKYRDYMSSGLVNPMETRCYCRIIIKTRESSDRELSMNQESFKSTAAELSCEQKSLGEGVVLSAKEERKADFTRTQVSNRNCRARRRMLKTSIKCEVEAKHEVMWVPRVCNKNDELR